MGLLGLFETGKQAGSFKIGFLKKAMRLLEFLNFEASWKFQN